MHSYKFLVTLISVLIIANTAKSQTYKNFLKEYKAPEFSLSSLDFSNEIGARNNYWGGSVESYFSNVLNVNYQFYKNSESYQGNLNGRMSNYIRFKSVKPDVVEGTKYFSNTISFSLISNNYFYLKKDMRFLSVHGGLTEVYNYTNNDEDKTRYNSFVLTPAVGVGIGRLEPVQYARSAMDLQLLLNRSSVLTTDYSTEDLKQIADKIAEINNVRFYDFRLRRIVQLEELDETLQEIGNISEKNIRYFASMADAYLYSKVFTRFSGMRNELGVTAGLDKKLNEIEEGVLSTQKRLFAYYKFDWHIPQSYALQHNLRATVFSGTQQFSTETYPTVSKVNPLFVHASYVFSTYPTTRTNFRFGVEGFCGTPLGPFFLTTGGARVALFTEGDIYFSPRIRAFYSAGYTRGFGIMIPLQNLDHLYQVDHRMYWPSKYRFDFKAGISIALF